VTENSSPTFPVTDDIIRQGSGEQAAAYIRRLIFDGDLRQGMRLPQDKVAKALGVSRIPIREAIVALEREGWVTTRLHRGAAVNAFDEEAIRDHYELFGLIYGLAARRAVLRGDPEFVERLVAISRDIAARDDPIELEKLAIAFHSTIVDAARSPRIPTVLRAMSALVPGPFFVLVPHAIEVEKKGLAAIVRAVKKGDGDRAAREYSKMLGQQAELVVALFRERNLVSRSA
jgi:DNA-binding GntR family transcriptional regulator